MTEEEQIEALTSIPADVAAEIEDRMLALLFEMLLDASTKT